MKRRSHDTRTLVYFYMVAVHGSYRRAAEHLALTVSALSRPLQQLERDLGVLLFVRGGKHETLLTPAGRCFLLEIEPVLEQLLQLRTWADHEHRARQRSHVS